MPQSTQCLGCANYQGPFDTGSHCKAFPYEDGKAIPEEIMTGLFDHRNPHKEDNGIKYESNGLIDTIDDEPMDTSAQPPL